MASDAFTENLENEINTAHAMIEAPGVKVLVVAICATADVPDEAPATAIRWGGLCRAVSNGTTRADAQFFITGLETEIARLKKLAGL